MVSCVFSRACADSFTIYKNSGKVEDRQFYCVNGCANQTKCGDMVVPVQHLSVCTAINFVAETSFSISLFVMLFIHFSSGHYENYTQVRKQLFTIKCSSFSYKMKNTALIWQIMIYAVLPLQGCRRYDEPTHQAIVEDNFSEGVDDADFLLYVAAVNTSRCLNSVAYATYCQTEVGFLFCWSCWEVQL